MQKSNINKFIFYSDSVFEYNYRGIGPKKSSGKWMQTGSNLILNSYSQQSLFSLDIEKNNNTTEDINVNIEIISDKDSDDYICIPIVNNKRVSFDPYRGNYSFKSKMSIDSISFVVIKRPKEFYAMGALAVIDPINTKVIEVNALKNSDLNIKIHIIDSLFRYRVFTNEKLKIKGNKIIFNDGKDKNILYFKKE